jgi:hypothetical protein
MGEPRACLSEIRMSTAKCDLCFGHGRGCAHKRIDEHEDGCTRKLASHASSPARSPAYGGDPLNMGPVPQHDGSRERSLLCRLVGRRLVSKSVLSGLENRGRSGRLQASGTLKKHSATKWALAARSAAACCAAKCRNQHRRGYDWWRERVFLALRCQEKVICPLLMCPWDGAGSWNRTAVALYCSSRDGRHCYLFTMSV